MPRPRKARKIRAEYEVFYFKPRGIRLSSLEEVCLEPDELEAMRLVDKEGMNMDEAAKSMKISKPTLCRMVNSGRRKAAEAISEGKAISINNYSLIQNNMPNFDGTGPEGKGPKTGRGMGKCKGAKGSEKGYGQGAGRGRRAGGRGRRQPE